MGWKPVEGDPFAEDELDFADLVKKREEQKLQPAPIGAVAVREQDYKPFAAFGQTAESPASVFEKVEPDASRPEGWSAVVDPQQYKEVAKGVPSGAVSFLGLGLQGAATVPSVGQANVLKNAQARLDMLDRLDRGEKPTPKFGDLTAAASLSDAYGYSALSPQQRAAERQKLQGQISAYRPTPIGEQPLYKAGEGVKEFAKGILPAAPGYEDAVGRQLGEGLGSMVAGLPFGVAGRIPATLFFGSAGAGEAATRALAFDQAEKRAGRPGLTQEQINTAALYGVGPGTTDLLPVETLLGRLRVPPALLKPLASAIGRIGGQAFIEGIQEGGQAFLQNFIAKEVYNPQQGLTEGVGGEAAIGGGVGGIAQAAKELFLRGFSGRRGAQAQAPGATPRADPFAQPLTPAPGGPGETVTRPETIDVDFEDLIPADRRLSPPQEPAPQAGARPPSPPLALPADPAERPPVQPGSEVSSAQASPPASPETPVETALAPSENLSMDGAMFALGGRSQPAAPERDALGYYSKAMEAAKALKQEKGTSEQMLAQLESGGVKSAEIEATGLDKFLLGTELAAQRKQVLGQRNQIAALKNELANPKAPPTPERAAEIQAQIAQAEPLVATAELRVAQAIRNSARSVTKQEITDYLGKSRVRLNEARYGGKAPEPDLRTIDQTPGSDNTVDFEIEDRDSGERFYVNVDDDAGNVFVQGPGGVIIPVDAPMNNQNLDDAEQAIALWLDKRGLPKDVTAAAEYEDWSLDEGNPTYREAVIHMGSGALGEGVSDYKDRHWPERNPVAHIRYQKLKDTRGREVLNLDEAQSTWAQSLRDNGPRNEARIEAIKQQILDLDGQHSDAVREAEEFARGHKYSRAAYGDMETVLRKMSVAPTLAQDVREAALAHWQNISRLGREKNLRYTELSNATQKGAPPHPFVNTTDQWLATAMRRVIQIAADEGVDGITITPGKVQNERYGKSNPIGSIDVEDQPTAKHADHRRLAFQDKQGILIGELSVHKGSGEIISGRGIFADKAKPGMPLSEVVGVNIAKNINAAKDGDEIVGDGLEIGGEGMRATYDGIYPRTLLKLLQKLDPSIKPEKTRLLPSGERDMARVMGGVYDKGKEAFASDFNFFPLTEKAKAKLAKEGQPMFALGAPNAKGRKRTGDGGGRDQSGGLAPLKGAPTVDGASGPDPRVVAAAEDYARSVGIDLKRQAVFAQVDEALATRIAAAYDAMPHTPNDPAVRAAYNDMVAQTVNQYRALERAGYKFWLYDESNDPYAGNPWNSIRDLRANQRMGVFATEAGFGSGVTPELNVEDSPMLADSGIRWPYGGPDGPLKRVLVNDLFRAVHDVFGHSIEGAGFRARGEENAWQAHIRLYYGPAVGAVTTETRGQNSWLNYGPYGEANRNASVEDTVFADQKLGLLPEWAWMEGRVGDMPDLFALNFGKPMAKRNRFKGPPEIDNDELDELAQQYYDEARDEAVSDYMADWRRDNDPDRYTVEASYDGDAPQKEYYDVIDDAQKKLEEEQYNWYSQPELPLNIPRRPFPENIRKHLPEDFEPEIIYQILHPYRSNEEGDDRFFTDAEAIAAGESHVARLAKDFEYEAEREEEGYRDNWGSDYAWNEAKARAHKELEEQAKEAEEEADLSEKYPWAVNAREYRDQMEASLARGEAFEVPKAIRESMFRAFSPVMESVPDGHYVAVVMRVEPIFRGLDETLDLLSHEIHGYSYASLGDASKELLQEKVRNENATLVKDRVRVIFQDYTGREHQMDGTLDGLFGVRAFYIQSGTKPGFCFTRLDLAGDFHKSLRGELWHEIAHALRIQGRIDPISWRTLAGHADNLRIMDMDVKDYLTSIGHPMAAEADEGVSLREAYEDAYAGRADLAELMAQESVSHMVELFSHGAINPTDFAASAIVADILEGKYSKKSPWAPVDSALDKTLTSTVRRLLNEEIDEIIEENEAIEAYAREHITPVNPGGGGSDADQGGQPASDPAARVPVRGSAATEITPGPEEFARSPRIGESFNRRSIARLRNAAIDRYLGGWFSPESIRLRAEMQGFTLEAWHGTKDTEFLVPKQYVEGKDFGFHMAINRPNAANERLNINDGASQIQGDYDHRKNANIMKLLVRAENPLRTTDLGSWVQPGRWQHMGEPGGEPDAKAIRTRTAIRNLAGRYGWADGEKLREFHRELGGLLELNGYDSIIYRNTVEDAGRDSLMVWDAARVRSAHDLFDPRALGQAGLFASTPFLEADLRTRLNEALVEEGLALGAIYAIGGKRAIGAPKALMEAAERMEGRGRTPEEVWDATGTYRGIEGKQRFEIDDSGAKIIGLDKVFQTPKPAGFLARMLGRTPGVRPGVKEANNVPLINVLHHPKLFNAYPFLRQMRVNLAYGAPKEGTLRFRDKGKTRIYKPIEAAGQTPDELLEVLMHEIQHYIQDREGFARGSDASLVPPTGFSENSTALYDPGMDRSQEYRNTYRHLARDKTLLKTTEPESLALQIIEAFERLDQAENPRDREGEQRWIGELGKRLEESMLVNLNDYYGSYGEAESNMVEQRLGMSAEQRRAKFPGQQLPEGLSDTSNQTRDYNKAYEEVMRRAMVFKKIKERWAEHEDLGDGITVVRPDENYLVYGKGRDSGLIEARLFSGVAAASVSFWPEFFDMPYPEQKRIADVAMRDLRSRNNRPALEEAPSDREFAFWAKYDPRMVAFDVRLYRNEIEELAKAEHGDDATVELEPSEGEARVTSRQVRIDSQQAKIDREKAAMAYDKLDQQLGKLYEAAEQKYGSDYRRKMTIEEKSRESAIRDKLMDLENQLDTDESSDEEEVSSYLDLTPIFERRDYFNVPSGVDRDLYQQMIIDEQLDRWGKLPRPGDDVDFSDLMKAQ